MYAPTRCQRPPKQASCVNRMPTDCNCQDHNNCQGNFSLRKIPQWTCSFQLRRVQTSRRRVLDTLTDCLQLSMGVPRHAMLHATESESTVSMCELVLQYWLTTDPRDSSMLSPHQGPSTIYVALPATRMTGFD